MSTTVPGPDGKPRCRWCEAAPEFFAYHDAEWGFPVAEDRRLFEKISLEGFQSGLSWLTILRKRDNFRAAFHGFDFERVARYGARDVDRLLADAGIVRHRGKIEAAINNAARACEMVDTHGSLAAWFWRFQPSPETRPRLITREVLMAMATSPESTAMSKELKKSGWRFVGPTTAYAFMQSEGLTNDHDATCFVHDACDVERRAVLGPR